MRIFSSVNKHNSFKNELEDKLVRLADNNHDGTIDPTEMSHVYEALGLVPSIELAKRGNNLTTHEFGEYFKIRGVYDANTDEF